ncbi:hypothetical protein J2X65_003550 [Ancylobacter sp. 3268]|nr:hypothetical protein [Ancylobacter sp. 3268]
MTTVDLNSSIPASIPDLIGRWKTFVEFANDVGCGYEAARQMYRRESIAPIYWEALIASCKKREIPGIDWEWLGRANAKSKA